MGQSELKAITSNHPQTQVKNASRLLLAFALIPISWESGMTFAGQSESKEMRNQNTVTIQYSVVTEQSNLRWTLASHFPHRRFSAKEWPFTSRSNDKGKKIKIGHSLYHVASNLERVHDKYYYRAKQCRIDYQKSSDSSAWISQWNPDKFILASFSGG